MASMILGMVLSAAGEGSVSVERLGQPCRARNVLAGRVVVDRASGREQFVLTNMNESSGAELIFIDCERGTAHVYRAPKGAGSWALNEVPGDRLIVGTFYDGQFMVFDLKTMAFVKTVGVPGETYLWNLAMGSDRRLYGGTYGNGKLAALDLNTYTVEDCGAPAPPNLYLRTVSATPEGRILCHFITEKPVTLLYDPATKRFAPPPKPLENVSEGVTWNGYFLAGHNVFQGGSLEPVTPLPFPIPPPEKGDWAVDTTLTTAERLFLRQGNIVYSYTKGDTALTRIADIDLRGGRLLASNRKGELLGVRGQDYFILRPGDKTLTLKPIPGESGPRPTLFLKADGGGKVWGGPTFGQTLYALDTRTKKAVNTGTVCDAGGEVYDVTFLAGSVYAASYSGGDIIRYDPAKPWDQWNGKNPHTLTSLGARGYIRPTGGIVTGPDGKLYSGWMAKYGVYGGAIAVTDPQTGDTTLIENPLGGERTQAISGLAVDSHYLYFGTSLGANGLADKTGDTVAFGILDRATQRLLLTHDFPGASSVHSLTLDTKTGRLAMVVGGRLELFDTAKRAFVTGELREPPRVSGASLASAGNGLLYYGSDRTLIALDLQTGQPTRLTEMPAPLARITVGKGGALYVACGVDVYRVRTQRP